MNAYKNKTWNNIIAIIVVLVAIALGLKSILSVMGIF
jgi:Mn2+/Fe2+ NRAMP family transporter